VLLDARSIPPGELLETDVCVVGGGAAGISVALGLVDHAARVILMEGGGVRPDEARPELYRGVTTGQPYYPLDECRLRYLGGSTNFWGGWCRPLDPLDFEEREWVPHSGWPFGKDHLEPHYRRAQVVCKLGPYNYDAHYWRAQPNGGAIQDLSGRLSDTIFQIGPTRFGEEYRPTLQRARNICLMLHANALQVEMDSSHRTATCIHAATVAGKRFRVSARILVLAAGGIENPRILLGSSRGRQSGPGNEHDLVGRYFADHLHVPVGLLRSTRGPVPRFYQVHRAKDTTVRGGMSVTEDVRRRERLLGCAMTLHDADDPHDVLAPTRQPESYESLRLLMKSLRRGERPDRLWQHLGNVVRGIDTVAALSYRKVVRPRPHRLIVGCRAEQAPNPESRVTLDDTMDCFDMRRARLHWQLTSQDLVSFEQARRIWTGQIDADRFDVTPFDSNGGGWPDRIAAAAHHIGTTRMHRDPKRGVVDEHCRVHGTSNLYVAGSSVFPTAGWAPPTLTIVALALRLADHIGERFARTDV
jgi:choline dehydrogenase-like flavoprotein